MSSFPCGITSNTSLISRWMAFAFSLYSQSVLLPKKDIISWIWSTFCKATLQFIMETHFNIIQTIIIPLGTAIKKKIFWKKEIVIKKLILSHTYYSRDCSFLIIKFNRKLNSIFFSSRSSEPFMASGSLLWAWSICSALISIFPVWFVWMKASLFAS